MFLFWRLSFLSLTTLMSGVPNVLFLPLWARCTRPVLILNLLDMELPVLLLLGVSTTSTSPAGTNEMRGEGSGVDS
jgi:hypothetical protein